MSAPGGAPVPCSELADFAAEQVRNVDGILARDREAGSPVDAQLPHDLKLAVDRECEAMLIAAIRGRWPGHSIISEEAGTEVGTDPYTWILDPLDGTVNYYHGLPLYCTSLACAAASAEDVMSDPVSAPVCAGAVYAGGIGELYVAARGSGATRNGEPLVAERAARLETSVISVALSLQDGSLPLTARLIETLGPRVRKSTRLGSTALELALVASGRLGALVQRGTNLWDFAAGRLLVEEAGGIVETREIRPGRYRIVAAAAAIHAELMDAVEGVWGP